VDLYRDMCRFFEVFHKRKSYIYSATVKEIQAGSFVRPRLQLITSCLAKCELNVII